MTRRYTCMWWSVKTLVLLFLVSVQNGVLSQSLAHQEGPASCPPDTTILPCRCRVRDSNEVQIWCSHSDLTRVLAPLRALSESRGSSKTRIDELILEGNRLGALPGNAFQDLRVVRLMLRENELQRLSATALTGQEDVITELFIVEPELTHFAPELLRPFHRLQAITLQAPKLRRLPRIEGLDALRYLRMEATERAAWRGVMIQGLPSLEQLHLGCNKRGTGMDKLEAGLLHGVPRLEEFSLNECALTWIHPHALAPAAVTLKSLDLSDNLLDDVGQVALALRDLAVLSELKLDRNEFRGLPEGSLVSLPALRALSLAGNRITEVARSAFHLLPSLEAVDLSNNAIKRLHPQAFTPHAAPRLQDINLAQNYLGHIAEVRPWVTTLPTLRRLDLSDNGLEELGWAALGPAGHPTLERLSLDNNRLRVVRRDALSALPALLELRLRNNSLDERSLLDGGSPWNLPGLKGLDLGKNLVRSLDARMLAGLPSLRRLDLSSNQVATLHGSPFSPAPLLEHVNLSGNALQALPAASLGPLRALYELDVSHNSLLSLPIHPGRALDGLGVLNVEGNQLGSIPEGWTSGQSTQTLQLSSNALRSLPRLELKGLTRLDVSQNLLSRLDSDTLGSARELVYLNASNNELSHFPEVRGLTSLREIDLSGNRLSMLPEPGMLSSLQSLRSLRLARNQLSSIGTGTIQGLPRLTALSLADNRLVKMEAAALSNLPALAELDLSRNALVNLPQSAFSQLPALRAASLQGNRLKQFDARSFENAPRLLLLDLSHNELRQLDWGQPAWSGHWIGREGEEEPAASRREARTSPRQARGPIRNVRRPALSASARAIEAGPDDRDLVPTSASNMPGLEVLDLSHNEIQNLEDAGVGNLPWLVELKVDNNDICGLRANTLSGLSRLRVLSMRNNRVSMLQERAFRSLRGNMVHLDVAGNPLSCSCGLMWLQTWMDEEPTLQPGVDAAQEGAPRCADGSLLREVALSRSNCQDHHRSLKEEQREEEEIMSRCSGKNSPLPHEPPPFGHSAPSPEDSLYFEEQYVDFPPGPEFIANQTSTIPAAITPPPPPPPPPPPQQQPPTTPPPSSDHTAGGTPTFYAGNKPAALPPNPPAVAVVNESPFTLFGYPIPSITSLLNPSLGRASVSKKIDANDNTAKSDHVTPYEDGFLPSIGPPRVRPPWVIGPSGSATSNNTSTSHIRAVSHIEAVSDRKKEVYTSTREQSTPMEPSNNPMKFPYIPNVQNKMPIDHRGSLPIRDEVWKLNNIPENTSEEVSTTVRPDWYDKVTRTERPDVPNTTPPNKRFEIFTEKMNESDFQYSERGVMYEKGVLPLTFYEETKEASTIRNFYDVPTEHPTTQPMETTTTKPVITTRKPVRLEITTTTQQPVELTTTPKTSTTKTTEPPPTGFTNLQLLVPNSSPSLQNSNKATVTRLESVPQPHQHSPSNSKYLNTPPTQSTPLSTTTDQQGQGTWWYYRDYNRTNLEPFRGEYLLEDEPTLLSSLAIKNKFNIFYILLPILFLFI